MTTQGTPALPPEQAPPVPQIPHQLTTAATTMLLALGAILCCLIVGAYVVRRYLLTHTLLGTRTTPLRVLARTYITPKAAVALLEVPGKLLVIGIAGGTMVALGEVTAASPSSETNTPSSPSIPSTSFATTLTQSAQQFIRQDEADATPLQVSERIQQKVSRLKQL
jgi:flagellar biogenesis protein FliO